MDQKQEFLDSLTAINPAYNFESIGRAFDKAQELHKGQVRKSGEEYIIHPAHVALILAELGMDEDTIIAGLLQIGRASCRERV